MDRVGGLAAADTARLKVCRTIVELGYWTLVLFTKTAFWAYEKFGPGLRQRDISSRFRERWKRSFSLSITSFKLKLAAFCRWVILECHQELAQGYSVRELNLGVPFGSARHPGTLQPWVPQQSLP